MAQIKTILATVEEGTLAHSFTEQFNPETKLDQYKAHFLNEFKKSNKSVSPKLTKIAVTIHDEKGDYKLDELGNRMFEPLFVDDCR